jgi:hypothetical protein
MSKRKIGTAPEASIRIIIGPRDKKVIRDLLLLGAMSRSQIQDLHFGSIQRCNSRLAKLRSAGHISRAYLPSALSAAQAVYTVGPSAGPIVQSVLADLGIELTREELRMQTRRPPLALLQHALAIGDVYAAFRKAAMGGIGFDLWLPERVVRQEYAIRRADASAGKEATWRKEVFNPDAFLRLAGPGTGRFHCFFFEVDLAHTNSRQFAAKVAIHQRYLESGLFTERFGERSFRTLVVTSGSESGRLRNLLALVEQAGSDLFWCTTFGLLAKFGPLAAIWHTPGGDQPVRLIDATADDMGTGRERT